MTREQRAELAQRLIARFRQLKDDEGWTQETLAEESGVKLRTVSDVLREKSVPNSQTLEKLAAAVGLALTPQQQREQTPDDVALFLDVLGIFLSARTKEERTQIMREMTKTWIFNQSGA
jgi:transcriptional regulator with XRE-family HTH domain